MLIAQFDQVAFEAIRQAPSLGVLCWLTVWIVNKFLGEIAKRDEWITKRDDRLMENEKRIVDALDRNTRALARRENDEH